MNKQNTKKQICLIGAIAIAGFTTLNAANNNVGSDTNPLVTKNYVDAEMAKQEQYITELRQEIQDLRQQKESSDTYKAVVVPQGQTIYGEDGTEMIVRAGEGTVVTSGALGIQNVTTGEDITNGVVAPRNHLLIVPREDGRGLFATRQLTVMVRGGYMIN